jgi:LysR family pca operon transcriptional activator
MQTELVGQRIKLQHLKVVMAVAEWGSMAKAAKHLAITQPVVSKVIADLEGLLGVRLFDRSPQGGSSRRLTAAPCSSAASRSSTI